MKELLEKLCLADGISGDECEVRNLIINMIKDHCEYRTDATGNLICFKKGKKSPRKKLMIAAHMDEVGFIVTSVREDGTLTFDTVGGIDPSAAAAQQVYIGKQRINGVIGSPAVHNLTESRRNEPQKISEMYIDIGASGRDEALRYVSVGDSVCFRSDFICMGENIIKSKAVDDRVGCAVLIEMILSDLEYDTWFVFTVREEIGLRGAGAATFSVDPDYAIVVESTTAADIDGVSGNKKVCCLGKGAVVSFMDRHTVYDKELYSIAFEEAEKAGIDCQTKTMIAGGNDSGIIHTTAGGVRTVAVSVPCRYLHSPSCVADLNDIDSVLKLVTLLAGRILENDKTD